MNTNGPVGVVGTRSMAAGIAQLFAEAGYRVLLYPGDADTLDFARRMLGRKVEKGQLDRSAGESASSALCPITSLDSLAECGLVIETQLSDRATTQASIAALEGVLSWQAIIALNTSTQPVSVLAGDAKQPQRIAGMHFFEPAPLMRIVEVIAGLRTDPALIPALTAIVKRIGHTPVVVQDSPGFVVNHVGRSLLTEGARIVADRVATPAMIDGIARQTLGLRMGPFELLDLIGLDISLPVMEQLYADFRQEPRLRPPAFLTLRHAAGLHGRVSGAGFYRYGESAAPHPQESVASVPSRDWPAVWLDPREADLYARVQTHLAGLSLQFDPGPRPQGDSLCLVMPLGCDASRAAVEDGLDPARTVAVDAVSGLSPLATLMGPPGLQDRWRDAALTMFASAGQVVWIGDSPGFVAQRLLAALVNLACDVAQQGIAEPENIDLAVRLALGYPRGPLAWGDAFGPARILAILKAMHADGDPRDRPSAWLRRRVELGLSLATRS